MHNKNLRVSVWYAPAEEVLEVKPLLESFLKKGIVVEIVDGAFISSERTAARVTSVDNVRTAVRVFYVRSGEMRPLNIIAVTSNTLKGKYDVCIGSRKRLAKLYVEGKLLDVLETIASSQ